MSIYHIIKPYTFLFSKSI